MLRGHSTAIWPTWRRSGEEVMFRIGYRNDSTSRIQGSCSPSFSRHTYRYQCGGIRGDHPGHRWGLKGSWTYPIRGAKASIRPVQVVPERWEPVTRIGAATLGII